jgi:hypothetical protein
MEGLGNIILFGLLAIGGFIFFSSSKNIARRISGLLLIVITLIFMYALPRWHSAQFEKNAMGTYKSNLGNKLAINATTYKLYNPENNQIDQGNVYFSSIDDGSINLMGKNNIKLGYSGELINQRNKGEVFWKE